LAGRRSSSGNPSPRHSASARDFAGREKWSAWRADRRAGDQSPCRSSAAGRREFGLVMRGIIGKAAKVGGEFPSLR